MSFRGASSGDSRAVVVVVGRTGSGKSFWSRQFSIGWCRRIVFDPFCSYPGASTVSDVDLIDLHATARDPAVDFAVQFSSPELLPLAADVAYSIGDCLLVVEELGVVLEGGRTMPEWLRRMILLGRHREISLLLIAQRAALIPTDARSQCSRFVSFAQSEYVDRDWLKKSFGPTIAGKISELKNYSCVDIDLLTCREYEYAVGGSGLDN